MFDNAGELVAGRMRDICYERGIKIISSVPYSPSSNGVAERLVGVATRGTRAMLHDAKLPPRFWAEAMSTYMYLRNRTPTTAITNTGANNAQFMRTPRHDDANNRHRNEACINRNHDEDSEVDGDKRQPLLTTRQRRLASSRYMYQYMTE